MSIRTLHAQTVPAKAAAYLPLILDHAPRLLSLMDREARSISFGSFDREHWAWKFRDFPITMLQTSVYPLALLWRFPFHDNPYYRKPQLLAWIVGAIENLLKRQHPNGAFDSVGPFTQDHGVSLAIAYWLAETAKILDADLPAQWYEAIRTAVRAACAFAQRSTEDYAFISNHQAFFALAYLDAAEMLEDDTYRRRSAAIVETIVDRQSRDGWYQEYGGADPGYESLGIAYLATYWQRTGSVRLLESLRRSIEFFAHCVHPDGSVGGVYGSRHTSLYFPAGFEIMSATIPQAAAIARFMRARLDRCNVVTPATVDAENLAPLLSAYLAACMAPDEGDCAPADPLPCETLDGIRHFDDSGISVVGSRRYYAVVHTAKGGVCRVFDKFSEKIAYEDAGYVVRAGRRIWSSQLGGAVNAAKERQPHELVSTTRLAEVRQELPTPGKFILLRILNLTVFRSLTLGRLVRGWVIGRLITARHFGPLRLRRAIRFTDGEIHFSDCLELTAPLTVDEVGLPRAFTAIHMGSAKYFHPSELESTFLPPVAQMAGELRAKRSACCEFSIRFMPNKEPPVVYNSETEGALGVRQEEQV